MNLKQEKLVTKAALPSFKIETMHEISYIFDVKGAAIEASASDKEIPISAVFKAPQSFAPSPHIPQVGLKGSD